MLHAKIITHFKKADPILAGLIENASLTMLTFSKDIFGDLIDCVISQQLSEKAGTSISKRFKKLFSDNNLTPESLLLFPDSSIRSCGIAWSKVSYMKNIALAVSKRQIDLNKLSEMQDAEVIKELTKIKGIGPWTAEMILMFSLARGDVFSVSDVGLRRAVQQLYTFRKPPSQNRLIQISNRWKPFRTYAALALWKSLEL